MDTNNAEMPHFEPETLSNYVSRLMRTTGISGYESSSSNKQISQSYVNRIKNGEVLKPSPQKLQALAQGLSVSEEELFSIVRGKAPNPIRLAGEQLDGLLSKFEQLPPSKKYYAQALIDLLNREFERLLREG